MRGGDLSNRAAPRGAVVYEHLLGYPPPGRRPEDPAGLFRRPVSWASYLQAHTTDDLVIAQVHRLREAHDTSMDLVTFYPPEAQLPLQNLALQERWPFSRTYATTPQRLLNGAIRWVYLSTHLDVEMFPPPGVHVARIADPAVSGAWQ